MNYYANFINLYTELDFFYLRMLLDRSAYCLNFDFRPALKCVYVQLKCVYHIFFIVFAFLQSYYKTGTKKERKKKKIYCTYFELRYFFLKKMSFYI